MIILGITATRSGMTARQTEKAIKMLAGWIPDVVEVHHGDCLGGDAEIDTLAETLGIRRVSHPPDNPALRAFCEAQEIRTPEPYLARNRSIVLQTCPLLAFPATQTEQKRGGTWSTVHCARYLHRPVIIVLPNGSVITERYRGEQPWNRKALS